MKWSSINYPIRVSTRISGYCHMRLICFESRLAVVKVFQKRVYVLQICFSCNLSFRDNCLVFFVRILYRKFPFLICVGMFQMHKHVICIVKSVMHVFQWFGYVIFFRIHHK